MPKLTSKYITIHTKLEEDFRWKLKYWAISCIIFSDFSCRIGICNFWNDPLGEFEGQTVLGQHGPSPPACFGSNERGFEPFLTAETGGKAWPLVSYNCLPYKFAQWIISKVTYTDSTQKIWKNYIYQNSVLQFSFKTVLQLSVFTYWYDKLNYDFFQ